MHAPWVPFERAALAVLVLLALVVQLRGFGEFFLEGHQGWNGSMRTAIARNYLRYGLATGLKPINDYGVLDDPASGHVFWRHPPGAHMSVALMCALFGEREWAARMVPLICSVLILLALWHSVRRRHGPWIAWLTCFLYIALPLHVEYGRMVNYEIVTMACAMWSLECLERYRHGARTRWAVLAVLAVGAACCVDWPGYIFALLIGLEALVRRPRKPLVFVSIGLLSAACLLFFLWWLGDASDGKTWLDVYRWRSGRQGGSWSTWLDRVGGNIAYYATWPIIGLSALGVLDQLRRRRVHPVIVVFGLGGLGYVAAFKQASIVHNYYIFYLLPALSLAGAWALGALMAWAPKRALGPVALAAVLALSAWSLGGRYREAHWRSYYIKPHHAANVDKRFPHVALLSQIVVARWLREHSGPDDAVAYYYRSRPSVQMKQYGARPIVSVSARGPDRRARFLLASSKRVPARLKRQWTSSYRSISVAGWLIIDTQRPPGHERVTLHRREATWWDRYWRGWTHMPFVLRHST